MNGVRNSWELRQRVRPGPIEVNAVQEFDALLAEHACALCNPLHAAPAQKILIDTQTP